MRNIVGPNDSIRRISLLLVTPSMTTADKVVSERVLWPVLPYKVLMPFDSASIKIPLLLFTALVEIR
jgi:hypothetical protein